MPRGGHFGLWKPTQKDIFKSRWKQFYKHCYRQRRGGNEVDFPTPHPQALRNHDAVPSLWRLRYGLYNFKETAGDGTSHTAHVPDANRYAQTTYAHNLRLYMEPFDKCCPDPAVRDLVLRGLDYGGHGQCDAGYGRVETDSPNPKEADRLKPVLLPNHIEDIVDRIKAAKTGENEERPGDNEERPSDQYSDVERFPVQRLYELCEEKEFVWRNAKRSAGRRRSLRNDAPSNDREERGRFPFVDEKASLIDELRLNDILRFRHRRNERRHPKWLDRAFLRRRRHKQYLRRRHMNKEEEKAKALNLRGLEA